MKWFKRKMMIITIKLILFKRLKSQERREKSKLTMIAEEKEGYKKIKYTLLTIQFQIAKPKVINPFSYQED